MPGHDPDARACIASVDGKDRLEATPDRLRARENRMKFVAGLTCHLCGATYPPKALWVCSECLGPLEVSYDYAAVRQGDQPRAD